MPRRIPVEETREAIRSFYDENHRWPTGNELAQILNVSTQTALNRMRHLEGDAQLPNRFGDRPYLPVAAATAVAEAEPAAGATDEGRLLLAAQLTPASFSAVYFQGALSGGALDRLIALLQEMRVNYPAQ